MGKRSDRRAEAEKKKRVRITLKSCPFCHGAAEIRVANDISGGGLFVFVECRICGYAQSPEWIPSTVRSMCRTIVRQERLWNRMIMEDELSE